MKEFTFGYVAPYEIKKETDGAAGFDLQYYSENDEELTIQPHDTVKIPLGIHVEIPSGYYGQISLRSSVGNTLILTNAPGIIDSDYRGEIKLNVYNHTDHEIVIISGERLCQLIIRQEIHISPKRVNDVSELSETKRGQSGFGSTGK